MKKIQIINVRQTLINYIYFDITSPIDFVIHIVKVHNFTINKDQEQDRKGQSVPHLLFENIGYSFLKQPEDRKTSASPATSSDGYYNVTTFLPP